MGLGVRKIVQQRRRWGHYSRGKSRRGDTRVYQKSSLPYLDSADNEEEDAKYWGGGGDNKEDMQEGR